MRSTLNAMMSIVQTSFPSSITNELFNLEVKDKPEERLSKRNVESYKTKLLVNGCVCENCKFHKRKAARDSDWCQKQQSQPKRNICELYETHQHDLFEEFAMEKPSESIYHIIPVYNYNKKENKS